MLAPQIPTPVCGLQSVIGNMLLENCANLLVPIQCESPSVALEQESIYDPLSEQTYATMYLLLYVLYVYVLLVQH